MKNELKIFENKAFGKVRVIERNNEPWFVGKDVAEALGYSQPAKAIREHVKDTHKGVSERTPRRQAANNNYRRSWIILISPSFKIASC